MVNIRISKYSINMVDNCRLIKVRYQQPEGGMFHPFDTRAKENNYISESGFSFLGNLDTITRRECIESIEKQLGENRHVRYIYQRIMIIKNGLIVWENSDRHAHEKDFFKGFAVQALYGEYIPNEHRYGYNITDVDISAEEAYVWDSCDFALGRAIEYTKKNPDNYCLLSGVNFDYHEIIRGSAAPPWCISQLTTPILQGLVQKKGSRVMYNTDSFFGYFKSLSNSEKDKFIAKYPEIEKWINWYATDGCHKNVDITEQYNLYIQKLNDRKNIVVSVSNTLSADHDPDNQLLIDESMYHKAREMFFEYNGSLTDMCADDTISSYMLFHVPKVLEKKWISELAEIWLDDVRKPQNIAQSAIEIISLIHRDMNTELIRKFADALEKSYFIVDLYVLLTIMEIAMEKIDSEIFGENEEYRYLLDKFEMFASESCESKKKACACDISQTEISERFLAILNKIREWKNENPPVYSDDEYTDESQEYSEESETDEDYTEENSDYTE